MLVDGQESGKDTRHEQTKLYKRRKEILTMEKTTSITELKRTDYKAYMYKHKDFKVCIIDKGNTFEAWLSYEKSGKASLMFAESKTELVCIDIAHSFNAFLKLVADRIEEYEALCPDKIEDLDYCGTIEGM